MHTVVGLVETFCKEAAFAVFADFNRLDECINNSG